MKEPTFENPIHQESYEEFLWENAGARSLFQLRAEAGPEWLIEGWLASSATVVSGRPEVGKSTLVAAMAAAVAKGEPFLGQPVETTRTGPVLVIVTDPGDGSQWAKKAEEHGVAGNSWVIAEFDPSRWSDYTSAALEAECRLVVFDNFTGAMDGNPKDADPSVVTKPLSVFVSHGIPVVGIAHATKSGSSEPMGSTAYKAWRRHGLEITADRKVKRTGNMGSFPTASLDSESTSPASDKKAEDGRKIAELALRAPAGSKISIAQWIAEHPEGPELGRETVRKRLRDMPLEYEDSRYHRRGTTPA